jgi:2-polyprenyl-3-methyl-5-hydroxy-6-metoxy-1,4-benzoquinol methylase
VFDKYGSRNPVVRYLMGGFYESLEALVSKSSARSIHEVGCGEGYWTTRWAARGLRARGSDFSEQVIALARQNARHSAGHPQFHVASIYDLTRPRDSAELVVCCEVLEHLDDPNGALEVLASIASPWLIVSVPREPIWSMMNMARGRYWSRLGNTPGHIQKWSRSEFLRLLSRSVEVVAVRTPLPWTMALCRAR